jgi:hypothetical protein
VTDDAVVGKELPSGVYIMELDNFKNASKLKVVKINDN